jgi:hypothetical protein
MFPTNVIHSNRIIIFDGEVSIVEKGSTRIAGSPLSKLYITPAKDILSAAESRAQWRIVVFINIKSRWEPPPGHNIPSMLRLYAAWTLQIPGPISISIDVPGTAGLLGALQYVRNSTRTLNRDNNTPADKTATAGEEIRIRDPILP